MSKCSVAKICIYLHQIESVELVSGFNLEYYRRLFVYIFLSEYINLLFISIILLIIFYGFNY